MASEGENRITTKQGESLIEINEFGYESAYSLVIRNMNGIVHSTQSYSKNEPFYDYMETVFKSVKRSELGVDKAIDDVKQRLMHL